jgi:hypothetical protein
VLAVGAGGPGGSLGLGLQRGAQPEGRPPAPQGGSPQAPPPREGSVAGGRRRAAEVGAFGFPRRGLRVAGTGYARSGLPRRGVARTRGLRLAKTVAQPRAVRGAGGRTREGRPRGRRTAADGPGSARVLAFPFSLRGLTLTLGMPSEGYARVAECRVRNGLGL